MIRALLIWLLLALPALAEPRVVIFGDSLTEGFGLATDQGLVPALDRWLAARGQGAHLVNAGLSGDTTYGGRVRINAALRRGADAVVVELGANDLLSGIEPGSAEANLDAILTRAGRDRMGRPRPLLLVGIAVPDRADAAQWAEIWPRLAARHDALLLPDLYAPITGAADPYALLQPDRLHPNAQGVEKLVEHIGPKLLELLDKIEKDAP